MNPTLRVALEGYKTRAGGDTGEPCGRIALSHGRIVRANCWYH